MQDSYQYLNQNSQDTKQQLIIDKKKDQYLRSLSVIQALIKKCKKQELIDVIQIDKLVDFTLLPLKYSSQNRFLQKLNQISLNIISQIVTLSEQTDVILTIHPNFLPGLKTQFISAVEQLQIDVIEQIGEVLVNISKSNWNLKLLLISEDLQFIMINMLQIYRSNMKEMTYECECILRQVITICDHIARCKQFASQVQFLYGQQIIQCLSNIQVSEQTINQAIDLIEKLYRKEYGMFYDEKQQLEQLLKFLQSNNELLYDQVYEIYKQIFNL